MKFCWVDCHLPPHCPITICTWHRPLFLFPRVSKTPPAPPSLLHWLPVLYRLSHWVFSLLPLGLHSPQFRIWFTVVMIWGYCRSCPWARDQVPPHLEVRSFVSASALATFCYGFITLPILMFVWEPCTVCFGDTWNAGLDELWAGIKMGGETSTTSDMWMIPL